MVYSIFFSPQGRRCAIIAYKHGVYEWPRELPNNLRLKGLRKLKKYQESI